MRTRTTIGRNSCTVVFRVPSQVLVVYCQDSRVNIRAAKDADHVHLSTKSLKGNIALIKLAALLGASRLRLSWTCT